MQKLHINTAFNLMNSDSAALILLTADHHNKPSHAIAVELMKLIFFTIVSI